MSLRLSNGVLLALAAVGVSSLLVCPATAQEAVETLKLERSEPGLAQVSSNLANQATVKRQKSRVLQEIDRPMKGFSLNNSLDGAPAPPIPYQPNRQVIPNKRQQEIMERRKEWIFMRPEDFTAAPTPEEMMNMPEYGPDGQEKKKLTPLERFFEDFGQKGKNSKASKESDTFGLKTGAANASGFGGQNDEDKSLPEGVRESAKKLRGLLGTAVLGGDTAPGGSAPGHTVLSDIFGLGSDTELTPGQIHDHQEYLKQYQNLLNGPPPANASSLSGLAPSPATPAPAGILGNTYGNLRSPGYDPTIGTVSPTYVPSVPSDLNSRVLTQWNPMQNYSAPESPKPAPAFTPIIDFPRRKF